MALTSRELVLQTLNFENPPRVPRQMWVLPWAEKTYPAEVKALHRDYPCDIGSAPGFLRETPHTEGNAHEIGRYKDDWGAVFENIQPGVIGEVKEPLIQDWETDTAQVHVPREWLTIDPDRINRFCADSDLFLMAGCCPRPFEQVQFLRGTTSLYMDLMMETPGMIRFLNEMHRFYCELLEAWTKTDVDALMFMDDWGSQQNLLIDPALWKHFFKPKYRDYIDIAHGAGKKMFMHSDGHILAIYPDLIELGLDAVNSQLFCMGLGAVAEHAGKITFWGEIDRQHLLPEGTEEEIEEAVRGVHAQLWKNGGCIAQCEFGPGGRPGNVRKVFETWDRLTGETA
jgi:uroporphyrinogen decarboxylase